MEARLHSSHRSASKQTVNLLNPTTPATRQAVQKHARTFVKAHCNQHGAPKEARNSRKRLLQRWRAGKVNKQTITPSARTTDNVRRKTGITLEERARDEHGIEAISGIFSSPEKSPPKRGSTITGSESMDLQESAHGHFTKLARLRWCPLRNYADMSTGRLNSQYHYLRCHSAQQPHPPASTSIAITDENHPRFFSAPTVVHGASRQLNRPFQSHSRNFAFSCRKALRFSRRRRR